MSNERKSTLSQVMNLAWQFVKRNGFNLSQALKAAWTNIKLKTAMAGRIVKFYFAKVDGTTREAYGTINADIIAHAENAIAKLDATNEKRKANPAKNTKKAEENAPIKAAILEALTAEAKTAPEIGAIVGVSHNKVTPLVKQLVDEGLAEVTDIKVPGKGACKGYSLAVAD